MKLKHNILFGIFLLILMGCFPLYNNFTTTQNLADIYNPSSTTIHPKFLVYHQDDNTTLLYMYIYSPELWFTQIFSQGTPEAKLKIQYKIMKSFENDMPIDTATIILTIKKSRTNLSLVTYLKLKPTTEKKYILQVFAKDLLRNTSYLTFIEVDKTNVNSSQNFILKYTDSHYPVFNSYISSDKEYNIEYTKTTKKIFVTRYKLDTTLARPPYSYNPKPTKFKKDTQIIIQNNVSFKSVQKGIYFIQTNPKIDSGKTIVNLGKHYPIVKTTMQMLEPLQYLTTSQEYKLMKQQANKKIVVDEFWLSTAENINHSKELLRIFYSRVLYANIYFTSHKEGWKTDRGMIYIVFGPPKYMYKEDGIEKWSFQDTQTSRIFTFEFAKKDTKFSSNNYILQRNMKYKKYWQNAIEYWRNGKIF